MAFPLVQIISIPNSLLSRALLFPGIIILTVKNKDFKMKFPYVFQVIIGLLIILSRMKPIASSGISPDDEGSSIQQPHHHFNLCCPLVCNIQYFTLLGHIIYIIYLITQPSKMISYYNKNSTGYPLPKDGMFTSMFDWISLRYGFT